MPPRTRIRADETKTLVNVVLMGITAGPKSGGVLGKMD
jgi:hypothetical protein